MNGKRIIDQPCLSRPEVFEIAVARLREEMAAQPDKTIWSVSQNDNFSYCQCPECLKVIEEEGSPAGPIIRFVNRVAALFPDKTISTLAYQYSRPAPRLTRPAPNVEVMLCTIELDRSRPIADAPVERVVRPRHRGLEPYLRPPLPLGLHGQFLPSRLALSRTCTSSSPTSGSSSTTASASISSRSNTGPGHEFSELKSYLLARLLWNPETDADAVMREFLDGYYGKAGRFIRQYIKALGQAPRTDRGQARHLRAAGGPCR